MLPIREIAARCAGVMTALGSWGEIAVVGETGAASDHIDLAVTSRLRQIRTGVRLRVQYCPVIADRPALPAGGSNGRCPLVSVCPMPAPGAHLLALRPGPELLRSTLQRPRSA